MPIPKPNDGEKQDAFIERCMGNPTMNSDYRDNSQRYAVCQSAWRDKTKKEETYNILIGISEFIKSLKNGK